MFPKKFHKASLITASFSSDKETTKLSIKAVFQTFAQPSRSAQRFANMQLCNACGRPFILPPSIIALRIRFPKLIFDSPIDRSIHRCKHCDALRADQDAVKAVLPPPTFENPITKFEVGVAKLRKVMEECEFDADDKQALDAVVESMLHKWAVLARARDQGIKNAWGRYTAIWGPKEE